MAREWQHLAIFAVLSNARTQHQNSCQSGPPANRVHHGGAGEVEHAELRGPATAPDPMTGNRVNDSDHQKGKNIEGAELDSFGDRPGDNRRRGAGKHKLKKELRPERNAGPVDRRIDSLISVAHCRAIVGSADKPKSVGADKGIAIAKHQTPSEN